MDIQTIYIRKWNEKHILVFTNKRSPDGDYANNEQDSLSSLWPQLACSFSCHDGSKGAALPGFNSTFQVRENRVFGKSYLCFS